MEKNILIFTQVNENHKKIIQEKAGSFKVVYSENTTVSLEQIQSAIVIFGNPPPKMLKDAKSLEWLHLHSAGLGVYADEGILPEGVVLTNSTGAYGLAISEYMIGVLLEIYKKLNLYRDNQAEGNWTHLGHVKSIYNSTVLILGTGDIGGEFAKRMKLLGAYTIGIKKTDKNKPYYLDELYTMDKLEELLPRADVIALCLPETKHTFKIINKNTIELMKTDAVIINVGRGSVIDTDALSEALENKRILGAAVDVTDPEPLPKDHRLWKLKNAVITPHISGGFFLPETQDRVVRIFANNLEAFLNGGILVNVQN